MKILLVLNILVASSSLVVGYTPLKIMDGQDAERNQFPYQISLQAKLDGDTSFSHFCGGSIISPNWILCAAHCTVTKNPAQLRVVAGILLLNDTNIPGQQTRNVLQYINHPLYPDADVVSPNDISLIRLDSPLQFTDNVQPISIPSYGRISRGSATLSGWGVWNSQNEIPNHLQFAVLPIVLEKECKAYWDVDDPFSEELNICSGTVKGDESSCQADSGGPYVQNKEVIGIVSWGNACGSGYPSVYTKTSAYSDWITNNTNGEVKPKY